MLPVFRHLPGVKARMQAMPTLFTRTRLASVTVVAGFAVLALALVTHMASTTLPLPVGGASHSAEVLSGPSRTATANRPDGQGQRVALAGPAAGPTPSPAVAFGAGSPSDGGPRAGPVGAGDPNGSGSEPQQVALTVGSPAPSHAPSGTPKAPAPGQSSPGTSPGNGTAGGGGHSDGDTQGGSGGGSAPAGGGVVDGHAPVPPPPPAAPNPAPTPASPSTTPGTTSGDDSSALGLAGRLQHGYCHHHWH
jgi:hypothetical protein